MNDPILAVLDRISEEYIAEAVRYRPAARGRKFVRIALIAAVCAALMSMGATGWHRFIRPEIESRDRRSYVYRLTESIPPDAPTTVETVYLPDLSVIFREWEIAYCNAKGLAEEAEIYTVFRGDDRHNITIDQYPFRVFQDHTGKLADAAYMADERILLELAGREVVCERHDGEIYDVYWADDAYCYRMHSSFGLPEQQWELLLQSLHVVPDFAEIAAAHPYYHPDSGVLESVLIPGWLPENVGNFTGTVTRYWADWQLMNEQGYGILFDQTPLDMRNYYTEDDSCGPYYGGEIEGWFLMRNCIVYVGNSGDFRDYFWYENGDRCQLRFDVETGLEFDVLARRIIESMTWMTTQEAEQHYNDGILPS